jgi:hypothetical protein
MVESSSAEKPTAEGADENVRDLWQFGPLPLRCCQVLAEDIEEPFPQCFP